MAIRTPPGPALGTQIVGRAVNDLMADRAAAAVAGGAAPQVSQPIPRYLVKLSDLTDVNFLAKAVQIGWRYLIVGAGPVAVADVKQVQSGAPSFDSLIHGDFADRVAQAADLAARQYGAHPDEFEARILEIPSIYLSALWLHGPRDVFFSTSQGPSGSQPPLQEDPSFILRAVRAAAAKRDATQRVNNMPNPEETGLQGAISVLIKAALSLNETARQLGQVQVQVKRDAPSGGPTAGQPGPAPLPAASDNDPAAPLAGEADDLSTGRDLANFGEPTAGAAATPALLTLDMGKVRAFLQACMNSTPRVTYGLGKKIPSLSSVPGRDFTQVDCSGFVRQALRLGTSPPVAFPDGSVVQHDWVDKQGFANSTPAAALQSDGLVRIAFLRPQDTSSHIGHVVLISGAKTLESHGGVGPDSRAWTATSWQASTFVYVLARDTAVAGSDAMPRTLALAGAAPPATFTVQHGHRYRATLALEGIEQFAGNAMVEGKLQGYGFINVHVTGSGVTRIAEASWNGPDMTGQLDSRIVSVVEIPA